MKNVIDLFIAKDRTAVFWFAMACTAILCSGVYISAIISNVAKKPQYVIMDGNGVYYLVPSVEFEAAADLHVMQTRLAMETIYNREPSKLVHEDRVGRMFLKKANEQLQAELKKDAKKFKEEQTVQAIEITEIKPYRKTPRSGPPKGYEVMEGRGILTRRGTYGGQTLVETLSVACRFAWRVNPAMANNGGYPTLCMEVFFVEQKKLEDDEL